MNREQLECYILETYAASSDNPWAKWPNYKVFRHIDNQKWFALVMNVPAAKLGRSGEAIIDVVNLKCDPPLIASLLAESGFYPAYHMSKDTWVTVELDAVEDNKLQVLLDMSFIATASKSAKDQ
ncbi:MmcQ/YjbR family DNA-binding protein [Cryptobacterium curtum]|uniref:MmcQ/YjbR family DNA-binding protein n=1 Tax=Cryptobacterium curtum TaxID=84163 RepID=UPI00248F16E1|nr:MmcQ/YjbR family DNA-binding protein [Cryptobacterium curtum]